MIPVIICGGVGTKMWPESRQKTPKHFLPLINGKTLFDCNYEALRKKYKPEEIFISTTESQRPMVRAVVPEIPEQNYIPEPEFRNQGPATSLIAAYLYKLGFKDETFMLVQVDDIREPVEEFLRMMDTCDKLARSSGKYITGGFKPDFAVMGVDYLIKGKRVTKDDDVAVYEVDKFVWRGTKEQVEGYLKNGDALLHTNHTCMTPANFMEMLKKYRMDWYTPMMNYINGADLKTEYASMPKGPVEEVTQLVFNDGGALVVELGFGWIDFGTWESLSKYEGEQTEGMNILIDSKNNFIMSKKTVAMVGVDDLVVVETDDALLICKKDQSGRVGEVVKKLQEQGRGDLL